MSNSRLPGLAERVLRMCLPRDWKEDIVADLEASYLSRRGSSRIRAWIWLGWQAAAFSLRFAMERLRRSPRAYLRPSAVFRTSPASRLGRWLDDLRQDVRYSLRSLFANPGYAAAAILTLALGIGANSAVFSVVHPLMFEPLPFERPEKLVALLEDVPPERGLGDRRRYALPVSRVQELRTARSVEGVAQIFGRTVTLLDRGVPTAVQLGFVSGGTFATLRARPLLGRLLEPIDYGGSGEPVVVLSHSAWQTRWQGDPGILGDAVSLDTPAGERRYRIVGVTQEDFQIPADLGGVAPDADLWTAGDFRGMGSGSGLTTLLRIRDDVPIDAAALEVNRLLAAMDLESARYNVASGEVSMAPAGEAVLVPLQASRLENVRPALFLLVGTVTLVLLIACTNVAGLMLGRAATRGREIGIRSALGATRGRLIRQVFTESLVLSLAGAAAGIGVAVGGIRVLSAWPGNLRPDASAAFFRLPRIEVIALDGAVFSFTLGIAVLSGLAFGLAPALALRRASQRARIDEGNVGGTASSTRRPRRRTRFGGRNGLIVAQTALATTLLVCAALLVQSSQRLSRVDPGFVSDGVVTFQVTASAARFEDTPPFGGGVPYFETLLESLRRLPGTQWVGQGPSPFEFGSGPSVRIEVPGIFEAAPTVSVLHVSHDYLRALGVPLLRGRHLEEGDDAGAVMSLLVNNAFVREHLGDGDPLGLRVEVSAGGPVAQAEIVGVVGDVRRAGLDSEPHPQAFLDYRQASAWGAVDYRSGFFAVRTTTPQVATASVPDLVRQVDPHARVERVMPLDEVVAESITGPRFYGGLLSLFAAIGVTLAAIGLYGVISHAVGRRRRELGIRSALGADRRTMLRMVLKEGVSLSVAGIGFGLVGAVVAARSLESLLFGIEPVDPRTLLTVSIFLAAVGVAATLVPARRATRVDPVTALRES